MTVITTDQYWELDGVPLTTPAWNIQELDGLEGLPSRRGSNIVAAYHPGEIWRPKQHGVSTKTMLMWICWKDQDGNEEVTREGRWGQFNRNLENFKAMIGDPVVQHTLKRYMYLDGVLVTRAFTVECTSTMQMKYAENDFWPSAEFALDFVLADPYAYGDDIVVNLSLASPLVHTMPGSIGVRKMQIHFDGQLINPVLTNNTNVVVLSYGATIAAGTGTLDVDTEYFTAIDDGGNNQLALVTHTGAREFFKMVVGDNNLLLSDDGGTGSATITYAPPYL